MVRLLTNSIGRWLLAFSVLAALSAADSAQVLVSVVASDIVPNQPQRSGMQLLIQEDRTVRGRFGSYHMGANFLVSKDGQQAKRLQHTGAVIQKIDTLYRIWDAEGQDITHQERSRGASDRFFEVFTLRTNGYSFEVDTFIDRQYGNNTSGEIHIWAAAIAVVPEDSTTPVQQHPLYDDFQLPLPGHVMFFSLNPFTQAGDLPSTISHSDQPLLPIGAYRHHVRISDNVVYRKVVVRWDPKIDGGRTQVTQSQLSLGSHAGYAAYWRKHVAPHFADAEMLAWR